VSTPANASRSSTIMIIPAPESLDDQSVVHQILNNACPASCITVSPI
jgi:hypothetical protein